MLLILLLVAGAAASEQAEYAAWVNGQQLLYNCSNNVGGCVLSAGVYNEKNLIDSCQTSLSTCALWPSSSSPLGGSYPMILVGGFEQPICIDFGTVLAGLPVRAWYETQFYLQEPTTRTYDAFSVPVYGTPLAIFKHTYEHPMQQVCNRFVNAYMTANLNLCGGSCASQELRDTMATAAEYVWGSANQSGCMFNLDANATLQAVLDPLTAVLESYNRGHVLLDLASPTNCTVQYGSGACPKVYVNSTVYQCQDQTAICDSGIACQGGCTEMQGFWRNHRFVAQKKKTSGSYADYCASSFRDQWATGSSCGFTDTDGALKLECRRAYVRPGGTGATCDDLSISDVFAAKPKKGEACVTSVRQMLAAEFNEGCFETAACMPAEIRATLEAMWDIVEEHCQCQGSLNEHVVNETLAARHALVRYTKVVEGYNAGDYGPGSCGDILAVTAPLTATESTKLTQVHWTNWFLFAVSIVGTLGLAAVIVLQICVWTDVSKIGKKIV